MNDVVARIDAYVATWNETDPEKRLDLIGRVWARGGSYADPGVEAAGHEEISANIGRVHTDFPGRRFVRTTTVDAHHQYARFGWAIVDPAAGAPTFGGTACATFDAEGGLTTMIGFFGPPEDLPGAEPA